MSKDETDMDASTSPRRGGVLQAVGNGGEVQLTARERQLINNFRALAPCAKDLMLDLSAEYKRTLPAAPVKLTLMC
jgi:hypothetical protein